MQLNARKWTYVTVSDFDGLESHLLGDLCGRLVDLFIVIISFEFHHTLIKIAWFGSATGSNYGVNILTP